MLVFLIPLVIPWISPWSGDSSKYFWQLVLIWTLLLRFDASRVFLKYRGTWELCFNYWFEETRTWELSFNYWFEFVIQSWEMKESYMFHKSWYLCIEKRSFLLLLCLLQINLKLNY
uniref:Uncharacterized protein n=1 Tax=Ananas comosus var. bracteatus TaxID=296719 RepID=A0A6V7NM82_ANACO|nr:unnamed protein product [Ananas comosus var. bracteatus]